MKPKNGNPAKKDTPVVKETDNQDKAYSDKLKSGKAAIDIAIAAERVHVAGMSQEQLKEYAVATRVQLLLNASTIEGMLGTIADVIRFDFTIAETLNKVINKEEVSPIDVAGWAAIIGRTNSK